jgi:peroxiredoxin
MRYESETLKPGATAPPFTLPDHRGETHSLAGYLAHGDLLLAFHRGTW